MHSKVRFWLRSTLALALACSFASCGNSAFDSVKNYKEFLSGAKPSLQAMNRVREELMQVDSAEDMLSKFKDELLPEVKKLASLAQKHPTPDVKKLKMIHETFQSVLSKYADSTEELVNALDKAKKDEDREAALVAWGGEDEKFGSSMAALVRDLEAYLDKLRKSK